MSEAPLWLLKMRSMNGLSEKPGSPDETKILAMADEIARIYPEMKSYCEGYNHDSIPWCGLAAADCMAASGVRPPFGGTDTDRFLWARSWADDPNYTVLKVPRLGCVVVLTRSGGGHVTFYESTSGSSYMCRGGNQSDAINLAPFSKSNVVALVWPREGGEPPPPMPSLLKPTLQKGDTGLAVVEMQTLLPKWIDGDFGTTTESLVKEFQRSKGLEVDGVCGPATWAALLEEEPPIVPAPPEGVLFYAKGKCSWFGGPDDMGVAPDEGLAFITRIDQAPELFLPYQPEGTTGLARRLDPSVFYIACRWDYKKTSREVLLSDSARVQATRTGIELSAYPADWGPNENTGRVADLSPGLMEALGIETDDEVTVVFPE